MVRHPRWVKEFPPAVLEAIDRASSEVMASFGLGAHLGAPLYQSCRGEVMREIRDEGMGVGAATLTW